VRRRGKRDVSSVVRVWRRGKPPSTTEEEGQATAPPRGAHVRPTQGPDGQGGKFFVLADLPQN